MKAVDEVMKAQLLADFETYATVVRNMEMGTLAVEIGIPQAHSLMDALVSDFLILDENLHDEFILVRNRISEKNMADKEARIANFKDPKDQLDKRNIQILILTQYDLKKHLTLVEVVKSMASSAGWLR